MKNEKPEVRSRVEILQPECYLPHGVFTVSHLSSILFSTERFQGRPNNILSYEKCDGGKKKISMWSRK